VASGIEQYCGNMTDGKIHLVPGKEPASKEA
jgi:hypothetical protein